MKLTVSEACISCGRCAEACPGTILEMRDGRPATDAAACIRCGHCEAICPTHALHNDILPHTGDSIPLEQFPVLEGEEAQKFLRSRRSVRCFLPGPVAREELEQLVDIGRYAQTGGNSQGVEYLVVTAPETMDELRRQVMERCRKSSDPGLQALYRRFSTADRDIILRGAPMCVITLTTPERKINSRYVITWLELYAPSLGLGTCWAGYLEAYLAENTPEMRELLQIPQGLVASGAVMVGYPKYRYYRTVERDPLRLHWR